MSVNDLPLATYSREWVAVSNALHGRQLRLDVSAGQACGPPPFSLTGLSAAQHAPGNSLRLDLRYQGDDSAWLIYIDLDDASCALSFWLQGAHISQLPTTLIAAACQLWLDHLGRAHPGLQALMLEEARVIDQPPTPNPHQRLVAANLRLSGRSIPLYCLGEPQALMTLLQRSAQHINSLPSLPLAIAFRCGQSRLQMAELRALDRGDILLLSDGPIAQQQCAVLVNRRPVWLAAVDQGCITLLHLWNPSMTQEPHPDTPVSDPQDSDQQPSPTPNSDEPAGHARLDDLPIDIYFDLPGETMALSEVQSLSPGHVFALPEAAESHIAITINGKTVGTGQLVNIEGSLGVQIKEWGVNGP